MKQPLTRPTELSSVSSDSEGQPLVIDLRTTPVRRRIDWKKTSTIVDSSSSSEESKRGEVKADTEVTCEVGEAARGMTDQEVQASGGQIDQAGIRERLAELRQMERAAMQSRDRFSNSFKLAAEISFIRTVRGGEIIEVISEVIKRFHPIPVVTFAERRDRLVRC